MCRSVFVDADASPVVDIVCDIARKYSLQVYLVTSLSAVRGVVPEGAEVIVVDNIPQAVDTKITNELSDGDIVVTGDYGLVNTSMAKGAKAISPMGKVFKEKDLEYLLAKAYNTKKMRRAGKRIKGPPGRRRKDDKRFRQEFIKLLKDLGS